MRNRNYAGVTPLKADRIVSPMPTISHASFVRAVANVSNLGDTDIFPFPIENVVFYDKPIETVSILEGMCASFDSIITSATIPSYSTLAPVGYTGFRWATQIDPIWNAYLLGAMIELGPDIEALRIPTEERKVFSYRFVTGDDAHIYGQGGWREFESQTRVKANESSFVVSVDIADFYSRIYHHRLENALNEVDHKRGIARQVMKILSLLTNGTSYGLPVGGPAARMMAELLLNRVDRLLLAEKTTENFTRYADDYRFFVDDLPSAYRALGYLSEKLQRNEGLALQKSKTRIMASSDFVSMLDPIDPVPGSAEKFLGLHLHYDPYSSTAVEDYEQVKQQLHEFDVFALLQEELRKSRIHSALTRRLVSAVKYLPGEVQVAAVSSLFDSVDVLAPIIPQVLICARDLMPSFDPEQREIVSGRVRGLIEREDPSTQIDLNLAYVVRLLAEHHNVDNERLLIRLFNGPHGFGSGPAPNIQRDILIALGRWRVRYWVSDQKNYIGSAHPWVQRAFWLTSYALGDEGAHWRRANRSTITDFDSVVKAWAGERVQQPDWILPL